MKINFIEYIQHKLQPFSFYNDYKPDKTNYQFIEVSFIIIILFLLVILAFFLNITCSLDTFFAKKI